MEPNKDALNLPKVVVDTSISYYKAETAPRRISDKREINIPSRYDHIMSHAPVLRDKLGVESGEEIFNKLAEIPRISDPSKLGEYKKPDGKTLYCDLEKGCVVVVERKPEGEKFPPPFRLVTAWGINPYRGGTVEERWQEYVYKDKIRNGYTN